MLSFCITMNKINSPVKFIKVNLYNDVEIGGRIYAQFCHLFAEVLLSDQKDHFYQHALTVMHKLTATKYHFENYKKLEFEQYNHAKRQFKRNPHETREAIELIFEIEAFLFKVKSSLDMLVKLLRPILGDGVVKTKTYSNKGDDLINGLCQYKKSKNANAGAVDKLIRLVEDSKQTWIQKAVELRDELNHDKGLRDYKFIPQVLSNGDITVVRPRFKNMEAVNYLSTVYSSNLIFHQDFMAHSLALKAPQAIFLAEETPKNTIEMYGPKIGPYVKFCWRAHGGSQKSG